MSLITLTEATWPEIDALDRATTIPALPAGATEAHGPHLPLSTDVIIAEGMIRASVDRLERAGIDVLLLPALAYTAAPFAAAFPGTVSVSPATVTALIVDVATALAGQGFERMAIANAHLDPAHIGAIRAAIDSAPIELIFPDVTRKPWASRLTDEFKSGACHAGQYEGSIVMAERPDLVKDRIQAGLAPNPASLSDAIRAGKSSFAEAGGPDAYFGDPASASAAEGVATRRVLGEILADAILSA